jgi:hypothetical protein
MCDPLDGDDYNLFPSRAPLTAAQPDCGDYAPCVLSDGHEGDHEVYDDATGHVTRVPRVIPPGKEKSHE